jgi:hypothetical protein
LKPQIVDLYAEVYPSAPSALIFTATIYFYLSQRVATYCVTPIDEVVEMPQIIRIFYLDFH